MAIISLEAISIILCVFFVTKLKISHRVINLLLKGVKIYLPPTDDDYKQIATLAKQNKKSTKEGTIVRSCNTDEFINVMKDTKFADFDTANFLIIISIISTLFQEIDKIYGITKLGDLNIASSFSLITLTYMLYKNATWPMKESRYETRLFWLFFVVIFSIVMSIILVIDEYDYFNFFYTNNTNSNSSISNSNNINKLYRDNGNNLLRVNYTSICTILNNRINLIHESSITNNNDMIKNITNTVFIRVSPLYIRIFYCIIFSLSCSGYYRSCTRFAYFDNMLMNYPIKLKEIMLIQVQMKINTLNFSLRHLSTINKFRKILNLLTTIMLIDRISLNQIQQLYYIQTPIYYSILMILLVLECVLSLASIRVYSVLFLNNNYTTINEYCKSPDEKLLNTIRITMRKYNSHFWEIFSSIYNLSLLSLVLMMFYVNRSMINIDFDNEVNKEYLDYKNNDLFKNFFVENLMYVILLSIGISKCLFVNGYQMFLSKMETGKTKNLLY